MVRGLLYVGLARGVADERGLEAIAAGCASDAGSRLTLAEFKALVREQFFMLLIERGGSAGGDSRIAAAGRRRAPQGLGRPPRGAERSAADLRRSGHAARAVIATVRRSTGNRGRPASYGRRSRSIGELDMSLQGDRMRGRSQTTGRTRSTIA